MYEDVSLSRYVSLLKNIRGVFVYDPNVEPSDDLISWLKKKHRYRNVGVAPVLANDKITSNKTFKKLSFPLERLVSLSDTLKSGKPDWIVESLIISSAYVSPLFIHEPAFKRLDDLVLGKVLTDKELSEDQILRHMRITGYGMLDFHEEWSHSGYTSVIDDIIKEERSKRERTCKEDIKERFWRLIDEDEPWEGGRLVGGYYDILPYIDDESAKIISTEKDIAVGLSIVGGFMVEASDEG